MKMVRGMAENTSRFTGKYLKYYTCRRCSSLIEQWQRDEAPQLDVGSKKELKK